MVTVSSPDRIVYPDTSTTKAQVVGHFVEVADRVLAHMGGRPLTLQRFPKGVTSPGFMQKNASDYFPGLIGRYEVPRIDGTTTHPVVTDVAGIVYLANQNTLTFHMPTVTIDDFTRPDRLIIDLDPPADAIAIVREAAWATRSLLDELEIESIPVATGSKGYHITFGTNRELDMDEAGEFGQLAAALLSHRHPELLTTEFRKANRAGRVFCDWLRNRWGATSVVPWSLRPRRRPSVAVPITWDQLAATNPDSYELGDLPAEDPLIDLVAGPSNAAAGLARLREIVAAAGVTVEPFDRFRT